MVAGGVPPFSGRLLPSIHEPSTRNCRKIVGIPRALFVMRECSIRRATLPISAGFWSMPAEIGMSRVFNAC